MVPVALCGTAKLTKSQAQDVQIYRAILRFL
jgi:hypothetical protein